MQHYHTTCTLFLSNIKIRQVKNFCIACPELAYAIFNTHNHSVHNCTCTVLDVLDIPSHSYASARVLQCTPYLRERERVCVREGEREKECVRERVCVCVCVCVRDKVCVCVREREIKCVCERDKVCEREREIKCVCVREREGIE